MPPLFQSYSAVILDEDAFMAKLLEAILISFDFEKIIITHTAEQALQDIKHAKPDCLLLDWLSMDKKELSFARFIRCGQESPDRSLPIILCTGHTDIRKIVAARDNGVTEIVAKPMSPHQVMAKLDSALFKKREFVETENYVGPDRRRRSIPYSGEERRGKFGLHQDQIDAIVDERTGERADG